MEWKDWLLAKRIYLIMISHACLACPLIQRRPYPHSLNVTMLICQEFRTIEVVHRLRPYKPMAVVKTVASIVMQAYSDLGRCLSLLQSSKKDIIKTCRKLLLIFPNPAGETVTSPGFIHQLIHKFFIGDRYPLRFKEICCCHIHILEPILHIFSGLVLHFLAQTLDNALVSLA